jgi:hypothetical protein
LNLIKRHFENNNLNKTIMSSKKTKQLEREQGEQLVTYKQAQRLKYLGFDRSVDYFYLRSPSDSIEKYKARKAMNMNADSMRWSPVFSKPFVTYSAPTIANVLKWMRDEKNLFGWVAVCDSRKYYFNYASILMINTSKTTVFNNWEKAEKALLDELLNILEKDRERNERIAKQDKEIPF